MFLGRDTQRRKEITTRYGTSPTKWLLGIMLLFGMLTGFDANAQVTVTGCTGAGNGSYATLTAAATAIVAAQPAAVINIAISGDTTEPAGGATLVAGTWTSLTIQPTGGAARTISGAITAGNSLLTLNGSDNVTINGLNSGGNSLTISNTTASTTSGTSTIRLLADATSNTITNSTILGSGAMAVGTNGGNIWISTGTTTGNDNNTISNNTIGSAGANLSSKGIYGNGSTTNTAIGNSGNIITNNNFENIFGAAVTSAGLHTAGGCNTWTITNNRFYQTATRTWTTGAQHSAIWIAPSTASSGAQAFTVTGNIIGYASSTQTGTYTLTGSTGKFIGIFFNGITGGTVSDISSNTIAGVSMTGVTSSGTTTSSPFSGIIVSNGLVTANSNIIGSQSATGSLVFSTTTTSGTDIYGLFNFGNDAFTTNSNQIGGISLTNAGASGAFIFYGIRSWTVVGFTWTANSNLIGGTIANSIQSTTGSATAQVIGMNANVNPSTVTSNTVRNLTINNGTGTVTTASVIGISSTSSGANLTLNQNTIYNLSNTNATAATVVTGIQFTGSTANTVTASNIYNLSVSSTNSASEINGIRIAGGTSFITNNMISLGNGITNAVIINGIVEPSTASSNFAHNSIYIGGNPTAGSGNSFALNTLVTTNTRAIRDNILMNARSNAGASGKNYAIQVGGTAPSPAGLSCNYNLYYVTGTGGVFGRFNSLDVADLTAWKTAVGLDVNSLYGNPQFLDPTNATTPDLHLHPTNQTPAEGTGVVQSPLDFDGQTRSGLTPTDIGADAGNFTPLSGCAGTPATSTINGVASLCSGAGASLSLSTLYTDTGITYAWFSGTTPGGPYPTALGTGATQATGNLTANTYYIATITCGNSGLSFTTAEKSVLVNALPTVGVSPTTASYCTPGGTPVTLTASGASTYAWSGTGTPGLSASSGNPVTSTPSTSTVITVVGTDANGCVNQTTASITVSNTPTGVAASASPQTICKNATTTLTATAVSALPTLVSAYTFDTQTGAALDPMTGATTIIASNTSNGGTGDDIPTGLLTLPFTFNFNGIDYTQYSVSPDGWLKFGSPAGASEFTNGVASTSNLPKVYPVWDDLATGSNGNATVVTTGTSPNRIFKVQWLVTNPRVLAGSANTTFQLWLYEGSNKVEFRYGSVGTSTSASAGMTGGATNFQSITYSSNTASTGTANNANTTSPASGRLYSFTPTNATLTYAWTPVEFVDSPNTAVTTTVPLEESQTFTVVVSNGGCSAAPVQTTVNITEGALITADPVASTKCVGQTATFTVTATGPNLLYQWQKGGVDIPVGSNASAGTATLSLPNVQLADADNYSVVVTSDCGDPASSAAVALTVNALPTVAVSPTSATYCTPGGSPIALTASGASTYSWAGTGTPGLSAATGDSVTSTPTTSTVITVTGTDSNGCVNTATSAITVASTPTGVTASATPNTICSGGTATLNGTASATAPTTASNYTFAGSTGAYSAISGTAVAALGDDMAVGSLPIGFTFNYAGVNQTVFAASSNGFIEMGSTLSYIDNLSSGWTPSSNALASRPNIIAPLWEDNNTTGGTIQYLTTGSVGARVLTVQWTGMHVGSSGNASQPTINLQLKLYEGSNKIEFIYGSTSAAFTSTTASIGISGTVGNYRSVTPLSPASSSTSSSSTENTTISSATNFPSGTVYTFTPQTLPLTYAWTAATNVVSPTSLSTATTALTSTETFTLTASNAGCTATAQTTVTVSNGAAITADPVAATKCTGETATFSVTATGAGLTYQWRKGGIDIAIGSNASAGTATLSLTNVSAADAATYDVVVSSTCGSPATSAGAALTVNPTPTATAGSNSPVCTTGSLNLTATTDVGTSFAWTGPNSFTSTSQNPTISGVTTAAAGVYSVTATANGCTSAASNTTVVVNPTPSAVTIAPTSATICAGASVQLVASGGVVNATTSTLGAGTATTTPSTTASTLGPNPLQSYYGGTKQQTIILASELTGLGLSTGSVINSVAFNLAVAQIARTLQNLQVKVSNTALSAFASTTFAAAGTVVRNPANFTVAAGWNTISFDNGFTWDGSSNIIIEVNFSNNDTGGTGTSTAVYSTTGFASTLFYRNDSMTAAAIDTQATASFPAYTQRNNLRLGTTASSIAWTPAASGLDVYTGSTVNASPTGTTTYTATSTVNGCSSSSDVTVTVTPNYTITASAGANGSVTPSGVTSVCSGGSQAYSITADAGYHILDVLVDTVSQGPIATYTFSNVTANHTISATFESDCNNVALDSASATTGSICTNDTTTLTYSGLSGTGASVTWYDGLGGTGNTYGTGTPSSPVGPGTYYAYATGNCGSPVEIAVTVTGLPLPIVSAGDVSGCSGTPIPLAGSATPAGGSGSYSVANPYIGTSSTTYTYTYTAPNGCTVTSAPANITITSQPLWYLDADGDQYYTGAAVPSCLSPGAGYTQTVLGGGDCNDAVAGINPGAAEICYNNIDDNCDTILSEGCAPVVVNMTPSYNGSTLPSLATAIPAVPYSYAPYTNLKYRFRITNLSTGVTAPDVIQVSRFVTIPASIHSYNAQYTITASAVINEEVVPFAGNTITVNSPTIQLITLNTASCGATLASLTSTLTANPGLNATGYTFRIRLNDANPSPTYAFSQSSTRFVSANSFTGFPLQYATSYKVAVQYTFNDPVTNQPTQSGYGAECTVNTPSIPLTRIVSPTCGSQVATMNAGVTAQAASYATGYQFRIRLFADNGPTPTYYYTAVNPSRFSSLANFQGITLAYNTEYSISVQYSILNGSTTVWSGYGADCKVTTPFFPVTSLVPSQCGLSTPTSLTQQLNITPYPGFPHYMVKLDEISGEDVVNSEEREIAYSYFRLSDFAIAQPDKNYNVSVKIKLNGVFGDYDTACDLFTAPLGKTVTVIPFKATAYPNPFANNFMLDVKTASQSSVNLKVYDMVGRLIEQRDVTVSDMQSMTIGERYPAGVYNVVVSQEESVQTVRVVKR